MQEIIIGIAIGLPVGFATAHLVRYVTRKADQAKERIQSMCVELARQEGWIYNKHAERWENRYEPMVFTTDALVQYVEENYLPGLKQLTT